MIKPPIPVDELLRLETLRNLKILDTDPEERFDRVTRLARRIFGTPIALVSLVDSDRQWFKSKQGLEASETSRDISFCGHAILNNETMVINDAHSDDRFDDNPLVTQDPNIRFYAGYPLSAPDGSKVGTLCVIDREPREMSEEDLVLLEELGQMIEEEFAAAAMLHNDAITGLSNAAGFANVGKHLLAMCERTDVSATIMLVHLANWEMIKGAMGQDACDRAAIEITQMLLASFRDSDVVGRVSDNEFAVLLSGSDVEDIATARQRFLDRISSRNSRDAMDFELDVETFSLPYRAENHDGVNSLLNEARAIKEEDHRNSSKSERAQSA